jgi:toxin CptA
MHNAPSVTYPVGRSALYGWILGGVWLLGLVVFCGWCHVVAHVSWRQGVMLVSLLVTGGIALHAWCNPMTGVLRWTGVSWVWSEVSDCTTEGQVSVVVDWQRGLLLYFQPAPQPTAGAATNAARRGWWCWLVRSAQPSQWQDLRRAVYSPARMTSNPAPDALHTAMPNQP